ncbi:MAG: trypsin-like peptidase domain-containing protein, partial [Flavobacteriales bacterium]
MNKPILPLAILASLLISSAVSAQISFGGSPVGLSPAKSSLPDAPVQVMPAVDALALMVEDAEQRAAGNKRLRFGQNHATDLTLDNSGVWTTLANGDRVWRLGIECPEALSINFEFNTFVVPIGGQVFAYNPMGQVLGAFTAESNPGHTELGVDLLMGNRITIEYIEPATVVGQGQLRIGQVTHGYRDVFGMQKGFGDSGTCNNNAVCPINVGYLDQIRSVAILLSGGSGFCTGQLLDNCAHDGTPYFLTANHCLVGNPATWVFRFNWQSPVCTPNTNGPTNQSVSGSVELTSGTASDYGLLLLNTVPPASYNVFYSGWDKSGTVPTETRAIHHPSGDIKKFSIDNNSPSSTSWNGASVWKIAMWDDGTTEPGSSGSGLWDQNGRLIGQLFGGQATCSNNIDDNYGRFSVSYPNLTTWLGSCGNTTDGSVGLVETTTTANSLNVFPNPGSGSFTIGLPQGSQGQVRMRVSDATGRVVKDQTSA